MHFGPVEKMFAVELSELELAACCGTAVVVVPSVVLVALPVSEHRGQFDVPIGAELGGRTLVPDQLWEVPQLHSVAGGSGPVSAQTAV